MTDVVIANGGTGQATDVGSVLSLLARELGTLAEVRFDGVRRLGDPESLCADIAVAEKWGWRSMKRLGTGLAEYSSWFKTVHGELRGS